jgi:hypothetical protein
MLDGNSSSEKIFSLSGNIRRPRASNPVPVPWTGISKQNKQIHSTENMKRIHIRSAKTLLACAALAGIVSGGAFSTASAAQKAAGQIAEKAEKDKANCETHACKGKNGCKGKGGCKTGDMGCAGKNSCKGKGGCAVKDGKPTHGDKKKE